MRKLSPFELDQFDDEKEIQNYYERYEHDYNKFKSVYSNIRCQCDDWVPAEDSAAEAWTDQPQYGSGNI